MQLRGVQTGEQSETTKAKYLFPNLSFFDMLERLIFIGGQEKMTVKQS